MFMSLSLTKQCQPQGITCAKNRLVLDIDCVKRIKKQDMPNHLYFNSIPSLKKKSLAAGLFF